MRLIVDGQGLQTGRTQHVARECLYLDTTILRSSFNRPPFLLVGK